MYTFSATILSNWVTVQVDQKSVNLNLHQFVQAVILIKHFTTMCENFLS
jgi:hypothetical protein